MDRHIKFGTDGIRGNADTFPFTNDALVALGKSFSVWASKRYATSQPRFLIGCDTRISCPRIKQALIQGITAQNGLVTDAGIIPTPAVGCLVGKKSGFSCGIIISASHNRYTDNGIKLFDPITGKLTDIDEQQIIELFYNFFGGSMNDAPGTFPLTIWNEAIISYASIICSYFPKYFLQELTIVLDCAHGATFFVAPDIFTQLGATVIKLNDQPTGMNINDTCGSLHPEKLQKAVLMHNAHIGFAFDGDGDRVIAVNKDGIIKDGDDLLAILLEHPSFKENSGIVGTVMTNKGLENLLVSRNQKLIRAKVGDKYVAQELEKENYVLGGETSGHIIIKDFLVTGDGIFVALKVLESILSSGNIAMETFEKHAQVIINVPVACKKDLASNSIKPIIDQHEQLLSGGRVLVRYSGTENVLRIMTESLHPERANSCAMSLADELTQVLNSES